ELAVAVRPGAALAEAIVRFGIDDAELVQRGEITAARLHGFAAIEDQAADAELGEAKRGEEPTRPSPDHDDPWTVRPNGRDRRNVPGTVALSALPVVVRAHAQPKPRAGAARVDRPTQDADLADPVGIDANPARHRGAKGFVVGRLFEAQREVELSRHR